MTLEESVKYFEKWNPQFLIYGIKIKQSKDDNEDFLGILCESKIDMESKRVLFSYYHEYELNPLH
jgi:hypothetical protein